MSFDTVVGLIFLGMAAVFYTAYQLSIRVNWAMIYYKMCGGK